jgi:hypothetical protein
MRRSTYGRGLEERERKSRDREFCRRILREIVASGACFALLALSGIQVSFRERWERQWPVRGEREDAQPKLDIFVFEIQKNDISVVPSLSDFILSERGELKRSPMEKALS